MDFDLQIAEIFVYNKDYDKAFDYAMQFANNDIEAINFLGWLYYNQQCKFYNPENGFKMLKRAAELGDKNAIEFIEMMNVNNNDNERNYNTTSDNYINNNRSSNMEESNSDARFTAIGLSGSGKTCYVMGMYQQMAIGFEGFNLVTTNSKAHQLEDWCDVLNDQSKGRDRFPAGTDIGDISDYHFSLKYKNKSVMSVDWMDYAGGLLRADNHDNYSKLESSIENSSALYIFIDGELLCFKSTEDKIESVQRKCAFKINHFITEFSEKHNECLPPVVFVVTKADLCAPYFNNDDDSELQRVIRESFSNAFYNADSVVYVTKCTLGRDIADDDYHGKANPDMYMPFFLGLYHAYLDACRQIKLIIEGKKCNINKDIDPIRKLLEKERSKKYFRKEEKIKGLENKINDHSKNIQELDDELDKYRKMLKAVSDQLLRESKNFFTVFNGNVIRFETETV